MLKSRFVLLRVKMWFKFFPFVMIMMVAIRCCYYKCWQMFFSGWMPSDSDFDGHCLYTTSSWSSRRWSTGYSPCLYTHTENRNQGSAVSRYFFNHWKTSIWSKKEKKRKRKRKKGKPLSCLPLLPHYFECVCVFCFYRKFSRRYGVIECDPLVRKGLERTVSVTGSSFNP